MVAFIEEIFIEAQLKACDAFHSHKPTPMIVGHAKNLFSNEIIPGTEEIVEDGLCGFAWINIKPARGPLVKFLKSKGIGRNGDYGGYTISSYESTPGTGFSQSMEKNQAGCKAFVKVILKYFPDMNIYVGTRID